LRRSNRSSVRGTLTSGTPYAPWENPMGLFREISGFEICPVVSSGEVSSARPPGSDSLTKGWGRLDTVLAFELVCCGGISVVINAVLLSVPAGGSVLGSNMSIICEQHRSG
jgi:hypothetical protein